VLRISPAAIRLLATDVQFLSNFVDTLKNPILKENLDELIQTVALMQTDNPEEFFDVGQANRKYGRVDRTNGAILLEKYVLTLPLSPRFIAKTPCLEPEKVPRLFPHLYRYRRKTAHLLVTPQDLV
jgi:hypothetical protein